MRAKRKGVLYICKKKEVIEDVETVLTHCKHPECIYRSTIEGTQTPICFYAAVARELRGCKISECDKYKDGKKVRPRLKEDYYIQWDTELYEDDEDADTFWRGYF